MNKNYKKFIIILFCYFGAYMIYLLVSYSIALFKNITDMSTSTIISEISLNSFIFLLFLIFILWFVFALIYDKTRRFRIITIVFYMFWFFFCLLYFAFELETLKDESFLELFSSYPITIFYLVYFGIFLISYIIFFIFLLSKKYFKKLS